MRYIVFAQSAKSNDPLMLFIDAESLESAGDQAAQMDLKVTSVELANPTIPESWYAKAAGKSYPLPVQSDTPGGTIPSAPAWIYRGIGAMLAAVLGGGAFNWLTYSIIGSAGFKPPVASIVLWFGGLLFTALFVGGFVMLIIGATLAVLAPTLRRYEAELAQLRSGQK